MELITLTGRQINSPSIRIDSNRKATRDSRNADVWLRNEAINEATIKKDCFCLDQFRHSNPQRLTQSDKEGMHVYLFGDVLPIFELRT